MITLLFTMLLSSSLVLGEIRIAAAHPSGMLIVDGRGYGHGRGLGQWGARRMAERGATWSRILTHYYRGVRIARARSVTTMRVRIQDARAITVWSPQPYTIAVGSRRWRAEGRTRTVRVRRADGASIVERGAGRRGPWRRVARTARPVTLRSGRSALWVFRPGGGLRAYAGSLVVRERAGRLAAINHVGTETYLASVVPREMPASWPRAALQAQAVAARTYAVRVARHARAAGATADICATQACQVYGGVAWRRSLSDRPVRSTHPRTTTAVRSTTGRILTWRGSPILAQYSSSTGGYTDRGDAPYLRAVPDPGDAISPYHTWRELVSSSSFEQRYSSLGRIRRVRVVARNHRGAWGGRARRIVLEGSGGRRSMSGDTFQAAFGLRSDFFRVRWRRALFTRDLREGSRGHDVRHLQARLLEEGFYPRGAPRSTYYGPITRGAVRRYQRAHGIRATGVLGPITRRSLNRRA